MIAKITKRASFHNLVSYAYDKNKEAKLIDYKGIHVGTIQDIARSFEAQAKSNPRVKSPVGHISLSFSPKDSARLNNELMRQISNEYMERMGVRNTQFSIFRHFDHEHQHCHIIFNRIDNDRNTISDKNDFKRSVKICRELTLKYGLFMPHSEQRINKSRLRGQEKWKKEIADRVKYALSGARNWLDFRQRLSAVGISAELKFNRNSGRVIGISFSDGLHHFSGSELDKRMLTFHKIDKRLNNALEFQEFPLHASREENLTASSHIVLERAYELRKSMSEFSSLQRDGVRDESYYFHTKDPIVNVPSISIDLDWVIPLMLQPDPPQVSLGGGGGGGSPKKKRDDDEEERIKEHRNNPYRRKRR